MKIRSVVIAVAILAMMVIPSIASASSTFTVSVSERGLPSGTSWSGYVVNIATGANNTISTTSSVVTFSLGNGTYEYNFNSLKGYYPLNPNGYFTVSNGSYSLVALYQANSSSAVYTVTFTPENIGTSQWTLIINSISYTRSGSLVLNLNGGTYYYSASSNSGAAVVNTTQLDVISDSTVDLTFYTLPSSGLNGNINSFFLSTLGITIGDFYIVIGLLMGILVGYVLVKKTGNIVLFALPNLVISLLGDILSLMPLWMFIVELFGMFASIIIPAKINGEIDGLR